MRQTDELSDFREFNDQNINNKDENGNGVIQKLFKNAPCNISDYLVLFLQYGYQITCKDRETIRDKCEYEVYKNAGADTEFVGHPLVDIVKPHLSKEAAWKKAGKNADRDLILLLPGSRLMEIQKMLPTMLQAAKLILKKRPDTDFTMPRAKTIPLKMLEDMVKAAGVPVKIIEGDNYDVMFSADLALATSGTVTLEAALCGLGSVIVYKTSPVTAFIARRVINIPNIGLPNIVAGKRILPELLQEEFTPERLQQEALALLEPERNTQMKKDLAYVSERLGEPGAVHRVAELVLRIAEEKQ